MSKRKAKAVVQAGTLLAKAAAGRTLKSGSPKVKASDILADPEAVRQGGRKADRRS